MRRGNGPTHLPTNLSGGPSVCHNLRQTRNELWIAYRAVGKAGHVPSLSHASWTQPRAPKGDRQVDGFAQNHQTPLLSGTSLKVLVR